MSTLTEIQDAVTKLSLDEKKALLTWLRSENEPEISSAEQQQLLHSLDEAIRDIDSGKGVPMDEVRKRIRSWAAR